MASADVEVEAFEPERRAPPAPTTPSDVGQAATEADADHLWELRKHVLLLATLIATVILSAGGLNPPGGFWSGDDGDLLFFCCSSIAFAASMVVVPLLLLMRKVFRSKGVEYWALQVAMTLDLFALIGAYAVGTCQTVKTFIYVVALVSAALLYIGLQVRLVFLCTPQRRESLQIHRQQSRVSEQDDDDGRRNLVQRWGKHLLLLAALAAAITYEAALDLPGGFREGRTDDAGDHHGTYPKMYQVFSLCNTTAFVTSLVLIPILLLNKLFRDERMKHRALQFALALDLLGLAGAYAAGSCLQSPSFVNLSVLLVPVSLYTGVHVVVFMSKASPSYATWRKALREKMGQCVPGWLKKLFEHAEEEEQEEAAAMKRKLEKRRRDLLLLLAILATALTYHAGMRPPCDDDLVHYAAFFYGNAAAFVASLAVITTLLLLLNRKSSARGRRTLCYALWAFVILHAIGLTAAFAAGAYRRKILVADIFILVSAILVCAAFQVTLSVSETARGLVQWLGWPRLPLGADDQEEEEEEEGSEDDELDLGVAGGTDGEPLGVEVSSPLFGGALTLVLAVPVMAILANPVKLLVAAMVASIGVSIWRRSLAPPLRALARALQRRRRATPPAGSNASLGERLMPALCHGLGELIRKLCPGTWLWSVLVVVWLPALRPNLKLKLKMSSISAVLAVLVVSTATPAPDTATATADGTTTAAAAGTSTTATATVDAPSTATSSVTDDAPAAAAAATTTSARARMGRRVQPLVEARPRRNRRPSTRLIGHDWVN